MRKYIIILSLIIFFISSGTANAQETLRTPLCKAIQGGSLGNPETEDVEELIEYQEELLADFIGKVTVLRNASATYICHGFAWHMARGGDPAWMDGSDGIGDSDIQRYWDEGSYKEIDYERSNKYEWKDIDIICWYEKSSNVFLHSAIPTDEFNVVISKWFTGPLVKHRIDHCPYHRDDDDFKYRYFQFVSKKELEGLISVDSCISGGDIIASGQIDPSKSVTFKAGKKIRLTAGFHAPRGCSFRAIAKGCGVYPNEEFSEESLDHIPEAFSDSEMKHGVEKSKISIQDGITLHPNPSTGLIHIKTENGEPKQLQIYSTTGALVYSLETSEINVDIDLTGHARGMYIARIISGNNITNKRFIIE